MMLNRRGSRNALANNGSLNCDLPALQALQLPHSTKASTSFGKIRIPFNNARGKLVSAKAPKKIQTLKSIQSSQSQMQKSNYWTRTIHSQTTLKNHHGGRLVKDFPRGVDVDQACRGDEAGPYYLYGPAGGAADGLEQINELRKDASVGEDSQANIKQSGRGLREEQLHSTIQQISYITDNIGERPDNSNKQATMTMPTFRNETQTSLPENELGLSALSPSYIQAARNALQHDSVETQYMIKEITEMDHNQEVGLISQYQADLILSNYSMSPAKLQAKVDPSEMLGNSEEDRKKERSVVDYENENSLNIQQNTMYQQKEYDTSIQSHTNQANPTQNEARVRRPVNMELLASQQKVIEDPQISQNKKQKRDYQEDLLEMEPNDVFEQYLSSVENYKKSDKIKIANAQKEFDVRPPISGLSPQISMLHKITVKNQKLLKNHQHTTDTNGTQTLNDKSEISRTMQDKAVEMIMSTMNHSEDKSSSPMNFRKHEAGVQQDNQKGPQAKFNKTGDLNEVNSADSSGANSATMLPKHGEDQNQDVNLPRVASKYDSRLQKLPQMVASSQFDPSSGVAPGSAIGHSSALGPSSAVGPTTEIGPATAKGPSTLAGPTSSAGPNSDLASASAANAVVLNVRQAGTAAPILSSRLASKHQNRPQTLSKRTRQPPQTTRTKAINEEFIEEIDELGTGEPKIEQEQSKEHVKKEKPKDNFGENLLKIENIVQVSKNMDNKSAQIAESSMQSILTTRRQTLDPYVREIEKLYRKANIIIYHIQKVQALTTEARFTRLADLFDMLKDTVRMMDKTQLKAPKPPTTRQYEQFRRFERVVEANEEYLAGLNKDQINLHTKLRNVSKVKYVGLQRMYREGGSLDICRTQEDEMDDLKFGQGLMRIQGRKDMWKQKDGTLGPQDANQIKKVPKLMRAQQLTNLYNSTPVQEELEIVGKIQLQNQEEIFPRFSQKEDELELLEQNFEKKKLYFRWQQNNIFVEKINKDGVKVLVKQELNPVTMKYETTRKRATSQKEKRGNRSAPRTQKVKFNMKKRQDSSQKLSMNSIIETDQNEDYDDDSEIDEEDEINLEDASAKQGPTSQEMIKEQSDSPSDPQTPIKLKSSKLNRDLSASIKISQKQYLYQQKYSEPIDNNQDLKMNINKKEYLKPLQKKPKLNKVQPLIPVKRESNMDILGETKKKGEEGKNYQLYEKLNQKTEIKKLYLKNYYKQSEFAKAEKQDQQVANASVSNTTLTNSAKLSFPHTINIKFQDNGMDSSIKDPRLNNLTLRNQRSTAKSTTTDPLAAHKVSGSPYRIEEKDLDDLDLVDDIHKDEGIFDQNTRELIEPNRESDRKPTTVQGMHSESLIYPQHYIQAVEEHQIQQILNDAGEITPMRANAPGQQDSQLLSTGGLRQTKLNSMYPQDAQNTSNRLQNDLSTSPQVNLEHRYVQYANDQPADAPHKQWQILHQVNHFNSKDNNHQLRIINKRKSLGVPLNGSQLPPIHDFQIQGQDNRNRNQQLHGLRTAMDKRQVDDRLLQNQRNESETFEGSSREQMEHQGFSSRSKGYRHTRSDNLQVRRALDLKKYTKVKEQQFNGNKSRGALPPPGPAPEHHRDAQEGLVKIGPRYQMESKTNLQVPTRVTPLLLLEGGVNPDVVRPKFRRSSILNLRNSVSTQCLKPLRMPFAQDEIPEVSSTASVEALQSLQVLQASNMKGQ